LQKNKGMELYGYCIMPSHVHLIFRSALNDPSGLIRDFKGFTPAGASVISRNG